MVSRQGNHIEKSSRLAVDPFEEGLGWSSELGEFLFGLLENRNRLFQVSNLQLRKSGQVGPLGILPQLDLAHHLGCLVGRRNHGLLYRAWDVGAHDRDRLPLDERYQPVSARGNVHENHQGDGARIAELVHQFDRNTLVLEQGEEMGPKPVDARDRSGSCRGCATVHGSHVVVVLGDDLLEEDVGLELRRPVAPEQGENVMGAAPERLEPNTNIGRTISQTANETVHEPRRSTTKTPHARRGRELPPSDLRL